MSGKRGFTARATRTFIHLPHKRTSTGITDPTNTSSGSTEGGHYLWHDICSLSLHLADTMCLPNNSRAMSAERFHHFVLCHSLNSIYAGASSVYYHPQTCYKTAMQIRCCPGAPLPRACCLHCFVHAHLPVPLESAIMLLRAMLWLCRQILARVLRSVSRSGRPNEGSAHDFRTLAKWRDSRSNASLGSWSAGQRLVPAISRKIRKIVH